MDPSNVSASDSSNGTKTGSLASTTTTTVPDTTEFLQSGRTGRRNALPDILNEQHAHVATADLAAKMQSLSTGTAAPDNSTTSTSGGGSGPKYQSPGPGPSSARD